MTKEEAIALYESNWWEGKSDHNIAKFQLFEDRLRVPFDVFHRAISKTLGRPVYTHEFSSSNRDALTKEFLGDKPAPTLEEIIGLIPAEKLIVITT